MIDQMWKRMCDEAEHGLATRIIRLDPAQARRIHYGTTLLHMVAGQDYGDEVLLLLDSGADPDAIDWMGQTPLHRAAKYKCISACSLLLQRGASLDIPDTHGKTPLDFARKPYAQASPEEEERTQRMFELTRIARLLRGSRIPM